jgi:anti-anti-sigma factor
VAAFRQVLADLARSEQLVIDLSSVTFVDSAALGALIGGIRRVREFGGEVVVACARPTLRKLMETTGISRIVSVFETVDEAVAALEASAAERAHEDSATA